MNLAQVKVSHIPKRKLFQIERAVVREVTDQWFKEKAYFSGNFAEYVEVEFAGRRIQVAFTNTGRMHCGSPEATVNEMMRGLILTMATDQATGNLLKNHKDIIGNILDVFVHRLKEISERKFVLQRLQSLELGFGIAFGLDKSFYPIRKDRRLLEDLITVASLSTAQETAETLIHDMLETEALVSRELGVTFHIFMAQETEASFISLPLGKAQTSYVPLIGTHMLRCNILAHREGRETIQTGILKIDAPSRPVNFMVHKGFDLAVDEKGMMEKLRSTEALSIKDFTDSQTCFLKLLFNEYVQLASFLLSSRRIAAELRLLIIFPRVNIFKILHAENPAIPVEEPQTLGELAGLHDLRFKIKKPSIKKKKSSRRIPESVIQEKVFEAMKAIAWTVFHNVYNPVAAISEALQGYGASNYSDHQLLAVIRNTTEEVSSFLKKLQRIRRVVLSSNAQLLDIEASLAEEPQERQLDALEEIVANIQLAEIEQSKEIVISKVLDYFSLMTVRLEQIEKVSSLCIKQEILKELESATAMVLLQAKSFYNLVMGKQDKLKP